MCSPLRRMVAVLLATGLLGLGGCMHRPKLEDRNPSKFEEVGDVNVAVISVAPFAAMLKNLQNDLVLTPDAAIKEAIAVTQATTAYQDNATNAMLRLALGPSISASGTQSSKTDADGVTTTESQSQTNRTSPDPSKLGVPTVPPAGTASAPATAAVGEHNAMLRYQLATALRQEVAMLNSYVRDAPRMAGYDPYVVRFQVSVRPAARRTPFDAEVDITLVAPGDNNPVVVPLLVTDSQDASSVSSMQRNLTQLGLAIGSLKGSFGVLGEFGSRSEDVVTALGWHYQSSFNVTRKNDQTLSLRAYAMPTGYDRFELMPRVYHMTALVLAKRDAQARTLTYLPKVRFWHAIHGTPIPDLNGKTAEAKDNKFEVPYWPDAVMPADGQRLVVQVDGTEAPYQAIIKLRGGEFLRNDTYIGAEFDFLEKDGSEEYSRKFIASEVNVSRDAERWSSLDVVFKDLSENDLNAFKQKKLSLALKRSAASVCESESGASKPSKCPEEKIALNGPGVLSNLKKGKQVPMASLKVGKTLLVKSNGTAEITVASTVPEQSAPEVAAVEVDFDSGLPGRLLAPSPVCASIKGSKLRLVGNCNVTLQLRNVKPVVLELGKSSPTLTTSWVEILANATKVPGDPIIVEMLAYKKAPGSSGSRK